MKRILPFIVMATLLFVAVAGCGGGDDEDKETQKPTVVPTTPAATSPKPSPSPTTEPTPTVTLTPTVEPTPTPEPTIEPSPTPTVDPDLAEVVLAPVMANLVVAFAEANGQWQGYAGPNALPLSTLENGQLYWWYATKEMSLGTLKLYKGWNNMMWLEPSAPIASALAGNEASVLFVVVTDIQSGKNYLYQSSAVKPLTVIPVGQKYSTFVAPPGNLPQMSTKTR